MVMTARDKELALKFIENSDPPNPTEYQEPMGWTGSFNWYNGYDGSQFHKITASYGDLVYREDEGLKYNGIYLDLSWWMRCRVYWAAKRYAEFGRAIEHDIFEAARQAAIAE